MKKWLLSALALSAFVAPASAETIAITGGKLVIGDGSEPVEGGTVVLRDGQVVAAGEGVAVPAGARQIDATGKWVTPGLVAGFSRVGLTEVDAVRTANDKSAGKSGFHAGLDIAPSIDPFRTPVAINRAEGVTRAVVVPETGDSIFGGQGAVADLGADANPVTQARAFQFVQFHAGASETAGGSRSATHLHFRAMLREAQDYAAGRDGFDDGLLRAEDAKALQAVLSGQQLLLVQADGANDILRLLELKRDFPGIRMVIAGAAEGWRVADRIRAAGVPVIASALNDLPSDFDQLASTQSNIGRMQAAGVNVAIGLVDDWDSFKLGYARQYAGNLVALRNVPGASGLTWNQAFAAITSKPADIMGMGGRFGSLKVGRAADLVIWDGDPLELSSAVERVFIDGIEQPLTSRQDRLRDRYRSPQEGVLPKAYDR